MKRQLLMTCVVAMIAAAGADVVTTQTLELKYGWNAVYVEVSPLVPLDEVFADWPVESVGFYDPVSFLATRQFDTGEAGDDPSSGPVAEWVRGMPLASNADHIPPGTVALAFSTNAEPTAVSVTGVPAAPRVTWHVTGTNDVFNFVGFSLHDGASVYPADYLAGFNGDILKGGIYKIGGRTPGESPKIVNAYSEKVRDGDVRLVASSVQGSWSGALFVSPMNGPDFGTAGTKATVSVRNDGGSSRTVAVDFLEDTAWCAIALPRGALHLRDADVAATNAAWSAFPLSGARIAEKRLEADETWKLELGLDRSKLAFAAKGTPFGALLRVTDVDGGSAMRVDIPLSGAASGESAAATAWPAGLWVADVAFNKVLRPGAPAATATGGRAKVRLLVHIDGEGKVRLLQRVVVAGTEDESGTLRYRLYVGKAQVPPAASVAMRISAVTLPTETPVIEAEGGGSFAGGGLSFAFTVAGDGPTSLLRHPFHPQHDGLRWDFTTSTPSGDDFQNYVSEVKPETFSVSCHISLALDLDGGEAAWNPEGEKAGTCRWTFSGLMRQGDVEISGPMTIKRVSPYAEIVFE